MKEAKYARRVKKQEHRDDDSGSGSPVIGSGSGSGSASGSGSGSDGSGSDSGSSSSYSSGSYSSSFSSCSTCSSHSCSCSSHSSSYSSSSDSESPKKPPTSRNNKKGAVVANTKKRAPVNTSNNEFIDKRKTGGSCAHAKRHHKMKKEAGNGVSTGGAARPKPKIMRKKPPRKKGDAKRDAITTDATPPFKDENDTASLSSDSYSSGDEESPTKSTPVEEEESTHSNNVDETDAMEIDITPTSQESYVYDEVLSDVILEVAFEMHKKLKTGVLCVNCNHTYIDMVNRAGYDIYGQAQSQLIAADNCECCNCSRTVTASRFAPHLEKCMGLGRTSRLATRRTRHPEKPVKVPSDESDGEFSASSQTSNSSHTHTTTHPHTQANGPSHTHPPAALPLLPPPVAVGVGGGGGGGGLSDGDADGDWKDPSYNYKPKKKTAKALKPKKKSKKFSGEEIDLTDPKIRVLLLTTCGVISPITGKMCTKTLKCPQHNDQLRNALRIQCNNLVPTDIIPLLGNGLATVPPPSLNGGGASAVSMAGSPDYSPDKFLAGGDDDVKIPRKRFGASSPLSDLASPSDLSPNNDGSPMVYVDIEGDESEHGFSEVSSVSSDGVGNKKIKLEADED